MLTSQEYEVTITKEAFLRVILDKKCNQSTENKCIRKQDFAYILISIFS